jgi:hypothetical protein
MFSEGKRGPESFLLRAPLILNPDSQFLAESSLVPQAPVG